MASGQTFKYTTFSVFCLHEAVFFGRSTPMVRRNLPLLLRFKKERDREGVIVWRWRQ